MKQIFSYKSLSEFLRRLHAVTGIVIGPFIFIAAFTGALYGLAFATESWFYRDVLFTQSTTTTIHSLDEQISAAIKVMRQGDELSAVRPGKRGETTRVLFTAPDLGGSDSRTVFVDPTTLEIKGNMITYGSGGAMPARRTIDILHRDLLLGQWGRWYSELAASWLWILACTGLILFINRTGTKLFESKNHYQKVASFHSKLGAISFLGLLMLSTTGLTWSNWAGDNISRIREVFHWTTPSVKREIPAIMTSTYDFTMFDKAAKIARKSGLNAERIEIKPGRRYQEAWLVTELGRSLPTHVDSVAIDPMTWKVIDRTEFKKFPLMAKLTRWGIDLHMGSLFGLFNQIFLVIGSFGICVIVITGYVMWFKRKGWRVALPASRSLWREYSRQPAGNAILILVSVIVVGIILPAFFVSLLIFTFVEEMIYYVKFYKVERS